MLNPGARIYRFRAQKGWTQAELAARAGIAQANLSNIEKGKQDITVSTLERVASALEVKPAALIEEENPSQRFKLTRTQIETLAECVVTPEKKTSSEIRKLAALFREILPQQSVHTSSKKIQQAWTTLKQRFSSQEIQGICQRIEDARQRRDAKTAN